MHEAVRRLWPELEWISDPDLREKTTRTWERALELSPLKPEDLNRIPFTLLVPNCPTTFMEHKRCVVHIARKAAESMKEFMGNALPINVDVAIAGAKLYYPDNTIQHAGIGIGLLTLAGHYHRGFPYAHPGYMGRLIYAQNVSAVTGACMMVRKRVYSELDGMDVRLEVAFNDVDFCLKAREKGYLVVFTPFAEFRVYLPRPAKLLQSIRLPTALQLQI
jgi:hypothetical protein